jgi:hypothetical protein
MALVLIPERSGAPGMGYGRGVWFPIAGINPTPQVEAFLDFLCDVNGVVVTLTQGTVD